MEREQFFEMMRQIPKAEIHLHLEDFLAGAAAREEQINSLFDFVKLFRSVQDSVEIVEDMSIAFKNMVHYMKHSGVVYAEVFFSPGRFLRESGWQYEELVRFFEKFAHGIKKRQGFTVKFLVDISRSHGVEKASSTLDLVIKHRSKYIIGIGLGGDEEVGPARDYVDLFKRAKDAGLRVVAHAGESDGPHSIMDAVELLRAERIGHATSAVNDPMTLNMLVAKQIPIEIAPTSNLVTGKYVKRIEEHPIKKFLEKGAFITLNTDDPTLFNTCLVEEYWKLYHKMGYELKHLYFIIVNGFRASFMSEGKKRDYIKQVNKKWIRSVNSDTRLYMLGNIFQGRE